MSIHEQIPASVAEKAHEMDRLRTNPFISLRDLESLCEGDENLEPCLRSMVSYSLRYTETVCQFEQVVMRGQVSNVDGERAEIERIRSTIHDSTIDSINILSRSLAKAGKDNSWISRLVSGGRAAYAKFAILIAFEIATQEN